MRLTLCLILWLAPAAAVADCVVLVHGLGRSAASMLALEWRLRLDGYDVVNQDYASADISLPEDAETVIAPAIAACDGRRPVHFVTHSMGGLVVRAYLADHTLPRLGKVVMLAPPNKGSEIIDALAEAPTFDWLIGPAGRKLGTGADSLPRTLGPARFALGVIAGARSLNPLTSYLIDGVDDGKVSVESTRVAGMADHLTLNATHTFIMNNPYAIEQTIHFLQNGRFHRD